MLVVFSLDGVSELIMLSQMGCAQLGRLQKQRNPSEEMVMELELNWLLLFHELSCEVFMHYFG